MMRHISQVVLPTFESSTFREYFLRYDGLRNIEHDLTVSLLPVYKCRAACSVCYLQGLWDTKNESKSALIWENLTKFFPYFDVLNSQDDLWLLRKEYPKLYDVYRNYGSLFTSCSMTDMAFVQQHNLLMSELSFKGVYDISFSERFLATQNWRLKQWVLGRIFKLHEKCSVHKVKIIVSTSHPQPESLEFLEQLRTKGISTDVYDNILLSRNIRHDVTTPTNRFDYEGQSYPLLTENCYLQSSTLYSTLVDATTGRNSFYELSATFDARSFLVKLLESKRDTYARYARTLSSSGVSNKYVDYFFYVAENLVVNKNFNFIPSVLLSRSSRFYQGLVASGFMPTQFGLLDSSQLGKPISSIIDIRTKDIPC